MTCNPAVWKRIPDYNFVRPEKSHLVNLMYVSKLENNILYVGNQAFKITKDRRRPIKERYIRYRKKKSEVLLMSGVGLSIFFSINDFLKAVLILWGLLGLSFRREKWIRIYVFAYGRNQSDKDKGISSGEYGNSDLGFIFVEHVEHGISKSEKY